MRNLKLSFFRRLTMHLWKDVARDPTIFGVCELDASKVLACMQRIRAEGGPKVTLLHAAALTLARSYRRYPDLNAKVVGSKILRLDSIDITFPVNLSPEEPGDLEILFGKVNDLDRLDLPQAAEAFRAAADRARKLGSSRATRWAQRVGDLVPNRVLSLGMNQGWDLFKRVNFSRLGMRHHPFGSTTISNIGALPVSPTLRGLSAMALIIPMGYVSSYLLGPTVDRPVAEDGEVVVRPIVPLTYGIDHRVVDGFGFMRYVDFWTRTFDDPERFLMRDEDPHAAA